MRINVRPLCVAGALLAQTFSSFGAEDAAVVQLRSELRDQGWLIYSAKSGQGDYDLFACRPDGLEVKNLTRTPEFTEYGAAVSPDGSRLLFRRLPKAPDIRPGEGINHDSWGAMGTLVVASPDGSKAQAMGKDGEFPWAAWSPDGKQFACLYRREGKIRIHEAASGKVVREMPREGIFQQLFWARDGQRLCGTANLNGRDWNIVSLELATGKATQVSRNLCCTPDWFRGDPQRIIYSARIPGLGSDYGWTMLMQAGADGKTRGLIYGERGRHVYYGCTSPDDRYVVFSVPEGDGGTDAEMAVIRMADAPIIVPADYKALQELFPNARSGPVLRLGVAGFEPEWAKANVGGN